MELIDKVRFVGLRPSDRIVGRFRSFIQFEAIVISFFDLLIEIQLLIVFKIIPIACAFSSTSDWSGVGLSPRRFRTGVVDVFPGCIDIAAGVTRRGGGIVTQALAQQIRILRRAQNLFFH